MLRGNYWRISQLSENVASGPVQLDSFFARGAPEIDITARRGMTNSQADYDNEKGKTHVEVRITSNG